MSEQSKGTALVTGASSGIGATYADRLAQRGYDLILVARDQQRLEDLAAKLRKEAGVKVEVFKADLTAGDDLSRVEQRLREDAAITLLVNNAGIGPGGGSVLASNPEHLERMLQLNIIALHRLTLAAAGAFVPRGAGVIINLGSVVSLVPEAFSGTYAATKAFVLSFTQSLNTEIAGSGVRLQAVLPGLTRTEIFERAGGDIARYDPAMIMEVGDLVDAALAGLDQGELITIPSLPDPADWEAVVSARLALRPNLSKNRPADRYGLPQPKVA